MKTASVVVDRRVQPRKPHRNAASRASRLRVGSIMAAQRLPGERFQRGLFASNKRPSPKSFTSPPDSVTKSARAQVSSVIPAAAACRLPKLGSRSARLLGLICLTNRSTTPLPATTKTPSTRAYFLMAACVALLPMLRTSGAAARNGSNGDSG